MIGVADDGSIVGIERDGFESDDKFMRLAQVVRNGLGDRAGTCIDPRTQVVQGKTVCVVSCQRSPEPVFLKCKDMNADTDFFVRSGPGTVKLPPDSAREYIRTRFGSLKTAPTPEPPRVERIEVGSHQGAGKSLTMVFHAGRIVREPVRLHGTPPRAYAPPTGRTKTMAGCHQGRHDRLRVGPAGPAATHPQQPAARSAGQSFSAIRAIRSGS